MDASWDIYILQVMDKPAAVLVDSALARYAPLKSHPEIVLCQIPVLSFRKNKLPSEAAFETIYAFEDRSKTIATATAQSMFVGRVAVGELVTFHYYASDGQALANKFNASADLRAISKFRCSVKVDVQWKHYFEFLYPTPEIRNSIENEKVRESLRKAGDDGMAARHVEHYAYFKTAFAAKRFAELMMEQQYTIIRMSEPPEGRNGNWLVLFKRSAKPAELDPVTWSLHQQAERLAGHYDGWETIVIPGKDAPPKSK